MLTFHVWVECEVQASVWVQRTDLRAECRISAGLAQVLFLGPPLYVGAEGQSGDARLDDMLKLSIKQVRFGKSNGLVVGNDIAEKEGSEVGRPLIPASKTWCIASGSKETPKGRAPANHFAERIS